ncbi:hypothetical protein Zmor_012998 [Zophobas morio]|uniref:Uncharacterized protein n=1 Tax=Zophobas morio TaxID=2755281 RepID=A0AA38IEV9_9CUCU|nr:hypothetical protein Zmor_012998 [Zophobas morio]
MESAAEAHFRRILNFAAPKRGDGDVAGVQRDRSRELEVNQAAHVVTMGDTCCQAHARRSNQEADDLSALDAGICIIECLTPDTGLNYCSGTLFRICQDGYRQRRGINKEDQQMDARREIFMDELAAV